MVSAVNVGVTRSSTLIADGDADGVADPGDTLRTTITIANTTNGAISTVVLSDTLTGSTLTGSVNVSPLAIDDSYSAVGNTLLLAGGATGSGPAMTVSGKLTDNDVEFLGDTFAVATATNAASANGGVYTINADGSFSYISAAGFTGTDTFNYTIRDDGQDGIAGNADDLTGTGTVTITVAEQVWYVDAASGSDTTGTGTSLKPFATVTKAATVDGANDYIYVKGNATGQIVMEQGERLIGTGSALVVGGNTLAAAGTNSALDGGTGYAVTLAGGGTGNNEVAGITLNGRVGIGGTNFGTLNLHDTQISTSEEALTLNIGSVTGTGLTSTTSTGGGNNVSLNSVSGTLNLGSGSLSGATGSAVVINGGTGSIDYNGSITHTSNAIAINVNSKAGGTVQFDGAISSTGSSDGINFISNTGTTINFTNTLTINTSFSGTAGFIATGGGTVSATGGGSTISSGAGPAVSIASTTIGSGGVTFQSVNTNGAPSAIILSNTGSGVFSVTGDGTPNSGGTINASTGPGVSLDTTGPVSLTQMNITNGSDDGIRGTNVSGLSLTNVDISGNGNAAGENGIDIANLRGTSTWTNTTVTGSYENNALISNSGSGTMRLTVTGSTFSSNSTTTGNGGLIVFTDGTSQNFLKVTGSTFSNNRGSHFELRSVGSTDGSTSDLIFTGNTLTNPQGSATVGAGPTLGGGILVLGSGSNDTTFDISNNSIQDSVLSAIQINLNSGSTAGALMQGTISGNTIGTNGDNLSGSHQATGIAIDAHGRGTVTVKVTSNVVRETLDTGMAVSANDGDGDLNLIVQNNILVPTQNNGIGSREAINLNIGATSANVPLGLPDSHTVRLDILNNTLDGGAFGTGDFRIRQRFETRVELLDFNNGGDPFNTTNVINYLVGRNTVTGGTGTATSNNGAAGDDGYHSTGSIPEPAAPSQPLLVSALPEANPAADPVVIVPAPTDEGPVHLPFRLGTGEGLLTQSALDLMVDAAMARWADAGASEAQLAAMRGVSITVENLGGLYLGRSGAGNVTLDDNAAGFGWFVDATPASDEEFAGEGGERIAIDPAAATRIDLLTALIHELGHQIGLYDEYGAGSDGVMAGTIDPGTRRLPDADDVAQAGGAAVEGAFALSPINIGTLPANKTLTIKFDSIINTYSNQLIPAITNTASVTSSAGSFSADEGLTIDSLTLGNLVFRDVDGNAAFDGADTGVDGVNLTLFADNGTTAGAFDAGDTQLATTTTAGGGLYSFTGLAPGEYIVRVDAGNFTAGNALAGYGSAVLGGDPDDNVDNDDNSAARVTGAVVSGAITLAYNTELTAGNGNDTNNTLDFGVIDVNDAPTITNIAGSVNYTEQNGKIKLDQSLDAVVADTDSTDFDGGSLTVAVASATANDGLFIENQGSGAGQIGVAGSAVSFEGTQFATFTGGGFGGSAIVFAFDGDATPAAVQALVRAMQYDNNAGDNPVQGNPNVDWTLVDGDGTANGGSDTGSFQSSVLIRAVDDAPENSVPTTILTVAKDGSLAFTGSNQVSVGDPDAGSGLLKVTITPTNGLVSFGGLPDFSAVITDTLGNINTALSAMAYIPTPGYTGAATITIVTDDQGHSGSGGPLTDTDVININVVANTAPVLDNTKSPVLADQGEDSGPPTGPAGALISALIDSSAVLGGLENFSDDDGDPAGLAITAADMANGSWFYSLDNGAAWAALGAVDDDNARLLAADAGTRIYFQPNLNYNGTQSITFRAWDGSTGSNGGMADPTPNGGATAFSSETDTASQTITAMNDLPVVTTSGGDTTYIENGAGTVIDSVLTLSDVDNAALFGATVRITPATYQSNQDLLSFVNSDPAIFGNVTASFNAATGAMTLTSAGGTATVVQWQAALRSVKYSNTSDDPLVTSRQIEFSASDGDGSSPVASRTVTVNAVNDAPVLDATKSPVLASILEDAGGPSGAVGTLVSSLVDPASPTGQLDNATDPDGPALGIAVTAAATSRGSWFYSLDNGANWSALGAVSGSSARLLPADGNTRIYFLPNSNYNGTQNSAITFRAWDGSTGTAGGTADTTTNGGSSAFSTATDTARLVVTAVNDAPVASSALLLTVEDVPVPPVLIGTDLIDFNFMSSAIITSLPGRGSLTLGGNPVSAGQEIPVLQLINLRFNPEADTFGTNYTTFTYQMRDNGGTANGGVDLSNVATITVNVSPVADTPSATGASTSEDVQTTSGLVISRNDVDGVEVTHFRISAITNGTLFKNDGTTVIANNSYITFAEASAGLRFTPAANFFGDATFNVQGATASNLLGLGGSVVPVTISVGAVADTPSITNATTDEDAQSASGLVVTRNAADGEEVTHFKITAITSGKLFLNDGATQVNDGDFIAFADANAGLRFTPDADFNGNGSFKLQASLSNSDAGLGGSVIDAAITVTPVNDAPVNTVPAGVSTDEDIALALTGADAISIADIDAGSGNLEVALSVGQGSLTMTTLAGLSFSNGDGTGDAAMTFSGTLASINAALASLAYLPSANFSGAVTLTVTTSDQGNSGSGGALTDSDTVAITVTPINDAPTAPGSRSVTTLEDAPSAFVAIGASDIDGDALSYALLPGAGPLLGTVSFSGSSFRYTPLVNAYGSDSFIVAISDGHGGTAQQAVSVSITPVVDAPIAAPDVFGTLEDVPLVLTTGDLTINDEEADGDIMLVTAVSGASGGTVVLDGSTITFTPAPGFSGTAGFNYTLTDVGGLSDTAHVTVNVSNVNDAPVVIPLDQALVTFVGTPIALDVAASDADGDPLAYVAGGAGHGTVTAGAGGHFVYTPIAGFAGSDGFSVTVSDGEGGSAVQAVSVEVIELPEAAGWRLFAPAGFAGAIGGSGLVFGNLADQHVRVLDLPGSIAFDATFNRGGDTVELPGAAGDWQVVQLGSQAVFSDGDTFVQVPVGVGATTILFDDGARTLEIEVGGMTIGGQAITGVLSPVTAAAGGGTGPGGDDPAARGLLLVGAGQDAAIEGTFLVQGTNDEERVEVLGGDVIFDASFNRGGDTIVIDRVAAGLGAVRQGSALVFDGTALDLVVPAGPAGTTLDFLDGARLLAFTGPTITLAVQDIGFAHLVLA